MEGGGFKATGGGGACCGDGGACPGGGACCGGGDACPGGGGGGGGGGGDGVIEVVVVVDFVVGVVLLVVVVVDDLFNHDPNSRIDRHHMSRIDRRPKSTTVGRRIESSWMSINIIIIIIRPQTTSIVRRDHFQRHVHVCVCVW